MSFNYLHHKKGISQMNRLIVAVGLCFVFPMMGMNLQEITQLITLEESQSFMKHLKMAVVFSKKMVTEQKVSDNNPIYIMLSGLADNLEKHDNDILKLIAADQDLAKRIDEYKKVDKEPVVLFGLNQVFKNKGDVKGARELVVLNRQILTGLKLQSKRPSYSQQWTGEVKTPDRIEFMQRNEEYPIDEEAIKDYISLFMYQSLLAPKI
jgi:hypothetical protein